MTQRDARAADRDEEFGQRARDGWRKNFGAEQARVGGQREGFSAQQALRPRAQPDAQRPARTPFSAGLGRSQVRSLPRIEHPPRLTMGIVRNRNRAIPQRHA